MKTVTGTALAFLSPYHSLSPADLEDPENVNKLTFTEKSDYWIKEGYTQVGTAEITVELFDQNELVSNKIDALRNQAASIRAEATAKCTRIEGQIQELLCIENGTAPLSPVKADDDDDFPF
jgi:hypothetical protein